MNKLSIRTKDLLLIALLALVAGGAGVFTMPVLDRDEARYAQATTQMLESGDFVQIKFQDRARNKKPVGIYWAQAASVQLLSSTEAREIWAFRIPSLLFAMLAALATYLAGRNLVGREAGFAGAALLAVSVLLATEAGIAKTDAALVASTTAMMVALAAIRHGNHKAMVLLFWVAMGLSILIKGPLGPGLVGLSLAVLVVWERKAAWLKPLMVWWGPVLLVLIVAPWVWAIQQATDGQFLQDALGGDFAAKITGGKESHGAPPGYYTLLLALTIFPASFFLIPGIRKSWQMRKTMIAGSDTRFLIAWIVPFFVVLELVPTKLVHYPLPVYPAIALLCGLGLQHLVQFRWTKYLSIGLAMIMPGVLVAVVVYLNWLQIPAAWDAPAMVWIMTLLVVVLSIAAAHFMLKNKAGYALLMAVLAGLSWHITLRTLVAPDIPLATTTDLIQSVLVEHDLHPRLSASAPASVLSVNYTEPSLVFALGTATVLAGDEAAIPKAIQNNSKTVIYSVERCDAEAMDANGPHGLGTFLTTMERENNQCVISNAPPFSGYNYSRGDCLSIHIFSLGQCK